MELEEGVCYNVSRNAAVAIMLGEEKFHVDILCRAIFIVEDLLEEVAV